MQGAFSAIPKDTSRAPPQPAAGLHQPALQTRQLRPRAVGSRGGGLPQFEMSAGSGP